MKKPPVYLKILALIGIVISILGLVMAIKVPGNIAYAPLVTALLIALITVLIARKNKYKCYGSYIGTIISIIGIIIVLYQQTKLPEVAVDEQQIEQIEETNDEITESEELDDALDELDLEEDLE